jgi:two-component system chemotaxis response regulator CheB
MPTRDIIVLGASAGGVEALSNVVAGLPPDLPAAVFVVLHIAPNSPSVLPRILGRAGKLPAEHANDGEPIRHGRVYVAPPGQHLLIRDGQVRLTRGPKENGYRPALDTLFRSAAVAAGPRVTGVVLSGALDDGTAGLRAIKGRGGLAIVQNPNEALFSGMPLSAVENVHVDHVLYLKDIPPMLNRLSREPAPDPGPAVPDQMKMESEIAFLSEEAMQAYERPGVPSTFSCPECHGTLFELIDGKLVRYRCRVGHAYSAETLLADQSSALEAALWSAMVALKEKAVLTHRMMKHMRARGHDTAAARFEEQAKDADQRAKVLQDLLERNRETPADTLTGAAAEDEIPGGEGGNGKGRS